MKYILKQIYTGIKRIAESLIYIFLNYIVANIPCWEIRKIFYKIFGMKIGKHSRIYMKCIVRVPWRIKIGTHTVINENCYLDGRGGLEIGDNVSISFFSIIITASHNSKSENFEYIKEKTIICDSAWIGARATILQGSRLEQGCILAAGSSLKGETEAGYIYAGVPAVKMKDRGIKRVTISNHFDFFR
mgnify:FL=1